MRNVIVLGSVAFACVVAVACSSSSEDDEAVVTEDDGGIEGGAGLPPGVDSSTSPPEGPAGTGANTGLPCDVQAIIARGSLSFEG